ncbi:hypothetical protein ABZ234_18615 [Nocardiopsis sp. NPDC006198]|uniref:hypothetical protein n=1 Tax=Nocardiopsis sp. NPDC006198 TaxID=3154472 RepID=UPI0033AF4F02
MISPDDAPLTAEEEAAVEQQGRYLTWQNEQDTRRTRSAQTGYTKLPKEGEST